MPDYAGLKAEIAKPAYDGMADEQIVSALTVPMTQSVDVPTGKVEGYFRSHMLMTALLNYAANGSDATLKEAATEFVGCIQSPHVSAFEMSDPAVNSTVAQTLAGFVLAGIITSQHESDLLNMATITTTIAQSYGFTAEVHDLSQEILAARRWS